MRNEDLTTSKPETTTKETTTTRPTGSGGGGGNEYLTTSKPQTTTEKAATTRPTGSGGGGGVGSGEAGAIGGGGVGGVPGACSIQCPEKPTGENCTEYYDGCCTRYICGDLPRNCQEGDTVFEIGQYYKHKCYTCSCSYSEQGAVSNCYNTYYCQGAPHKDCASLGKPQDECCEQFDCANTTCNLDGTYYAINEDWIARRDPCKNCTCVKKGNSPPETVCETLVCKDPPSPTCRPLKYADECCPHDWDCTNDYLITTARKYVRGHKVPLCVFGASQNVPVDLTFLLSDKSQNSSSVKMQGTTANGYSCSGLEVPRTIAESAILNVTGTVGQTKVQQQHRIMTVGISRTFVQTDKYLYLPGQLVQFRILTLTGSQGSVSYQSVDSVWIQSPTGNRLAQWTKVANPDGLLQLSFQLADEVRRFVCGNCSSLG
ncbi:uncharacterized protein LOC135205145 [Macrobrachium nipponense]|uniref:uncharacterized protein LOC135205145 n=1 Tax=Macrobrachium nipponense TaxID=159736 RepID=UPI0030C7A55D